jgi:tripartite-type tricarboxylate transporter receptor subunit TctC
MKLPRRQFLHLAAGAAVVTAISLTGTLAGQHAWSQTARTLRIVVPYAAGGPTDVLARLLAEHINRLHGATIVIENRPGANSVIGTEAVARAAPDGNTVLINTNSLVINSLLRKVNYDPLTGFEAICYLVSSPMVIAVNSASPYRSLGDLLSAARAKPGDVTLAGGGGAGQIAIEMFKRAANVNLTHVPYPGAAPAVNALLGGHVASALLDYSPVAEQINAGKLRALATASRERIAPLPNVPSVAETGYKDYEVDNSYGLFAPANTPKETVSLLAGWFVAAMQVPEVKEKLVVQGVYPVGICGPDFAAQIRKQYDDFGRVIREANIKAE